MASKVPKFGAWEGGDNFTVYFDNARKQKNNGQKINPNDPEENPELFQQMGGSAAPEPSKVDKQGKQTKVPQFGAWGNGDNSGYTVFFDNARKAKTGGPTISETVPQLNRDTPPQSNPSTQVEEVQARPTTTRSKVPQFGPQKKHDPNYKEESSDAAETNRDLAPLPQEGRSKVPQFGAWNGGENTQYTAYFDNARKSKTGPAPRPAEPQLNRDVRDRARPHPRVEPKEEGLRNASQGSNSTVSSSETPLEQRRQTPAAQPTPQPKAKHQPRTSARANATASIPQFGGWNKDPSQAEGYTTQFQIAKVEKNTPLNAHIPPSYNQPHYNNQQQPKGCCSIL